MYTDFVNTPIAPFSFSLADMAPTQVIVVDWTVADYQTLIAGMDPRIPVIVLQPGQSGLDGLAKALAGYKNLDAIHLVTEGHGGAIQLGAHWIDDAAIKADPADVAAIGAALKPGGDLLLYGCSVAYGEAGQTFINDLSAQLGHVDVVASTDKTGPTRLGGDWDLEYSTGNVETVLPFTLAGMQDISHCLGCVVSGTTILGPDGSTLWAHYYAPGAYWRADHALTSTGTPMSPGDTIGAANSADGASIMAIIDECSAPANTAPTFTGGANTGLTVLEDASITTITTEKLEVKDAEQATTARTFTVGTAPTKGSLTNNGSTISASGTFTQADIDSNLIKYTPTANANGADSFTFSVADGAGGTLTGQTFSITITAVNDAPTITNGASTSLTTTNEDTTSSSSLVSSFLTGASRADVDTSALSGMAITATTGNGTWQYSTDNATWNSFGTVSSTSALLLTSTSYVRYIPDSANGETATFTYRAWDQITGTASTNSVRGNADPSTNGTTTAYSVNTANGSIVVSSLNDAPTITNGASTSLTTTNEDTTSASSLVSAFLTDASRADVDSSALSGMAITATTGNGTWQYSTDNATWNSFGTVSSTSALLLTSTSYVRYIPDSANGETATFTYRAWDQTTGTASTNSVRGNVDSSTNGTTTAFSANTASGSIVVSSVNDAPTLGGAVASQGINDTATVSLFSGLTIADPDTGASETVSITLDTAAKGVFTSASLTASGFSTANGGLTYTHAPGTPAALQTAIRQLVFDPTNNRVSAGSTETTTFTVSVDDGIASAVTNNTTTVVATSVNDAPEVSELNGDIVTFIPGAPNAANDWIDSEYNGRLPGSFSDPDILGAGGYIQITRSTGPSAGSFFLWDDYHYSSDAGRTALGAGITIHRESDDVAVATVDGTDTGQDGAALKITLTAAATDLDAAYIIKSLQFNSATAGEYVFTLKVWDGFVFSNISTFEMRSPAVVTDVSATTVDGAYGVGGTISITVTFDKSVDVSGTPQLTLETGTPDRLATYASGTGTSTLTFTYTVQAGDTAADLDFTTTTALAPNSGTIIDTASGADAVLTLPAPSATGSLGFNKALVIDGNAPTISSNVTPLSYTENGAATALDSTATVTETGTPGASVLTVQISANGEAADTLSLPTGTGAGINVNGTDLRSATTNIGTVTTSSVTNSATWTITFLSSATEADIQSVVQAIRYNSTSENPGTLNRTVTFTLTDGAGNAATAATRTVAVTAENDAPSAVSPTTGTVSTFEGANFTVATLQASDVDNTTWTRLSKNASK
ncbi:MAG: DUF4347 domain-containing protein [Rhodoferax sp.]|nr:DUF4347 domain-containing protein [Rhodoferax sp.]